VKTNSDEDYLLSFVKEGGETSCLVAWTTTATPHEARIPVPNGVYEITSYDGKKKKETQVVNGTILLTIDGAPQYIKPSTTD
jgi:hypothetical protein